MKKITLCFPEGEIDGHLNVIIAVWAYFQLKDYIVMRERLVILMAKAVELMEVQKNLRGVQR